MPRENTLLGRRTTSALCKWAQSDTWASWHHQ